MERWPSKLMDKWMDRESARLVDEWTVCQMERQLASLMDRWVGRQPTRLMDKRMDRQPAE